MPPLNYNICIVQIQKTFETFESPFLLILSYEPFNSLTFSKFSQIVKNVGAKKFHSLS